MGGCSAIEDICQNLDPQNPLCWPSTRGGSPWPWDMFVYPSLETMVVIRLTVWLPSSTPKHENSAERDGSRGAGHESCIASYSWSMTIVFLQGPISDMVFMVFYNLIF